MLQRIFYISEWAGGIAGILVLVASLLFYYRKWNPGYMRCLPVYCIANAMTETVKAIFPHSEHPAYFLFTIFELLFFSFFLYRLIQSSVIKKLIIMLDILFLILLAYFLIKLGYFPFGGPEMLECGILIFPCIVYYKEFLSRRPFLILIKEPSFWVVTGLLFYIFPLLPILIISDDYNKKHLYDLSNAVYSIENYSQAVSYLLFIIAMLCKRPKSYFSW